MAATANLITVRMTDQDLREFPVVASDIIYRDTFVGLDPAGYLKPFEVGDTFVGIAYEQVDNSSGAAGAVYCRVVMQADFVYTLTSAAVLDSGTPVYATDDNAIALIGHPDAWVGYIIHKDVDASNKVVVRLKPPFQRWVPGIPGALEFALNGQPITPTGATAGTLYDSGVIAASALGLGVLNLALSGSGYDLQFDAVAEVASASLYTPGVLLASGGVTFETVLHLTDIGDAAALDVDWGLCAAVTANSIASMDHADATDIALFHMDGSSANILAQSDDGTTDVAATDTTIDNVTTALAHKEFKVIVRPSGSVQFWIDRARVLSSTTFAVATTALLSGIINMEKTSDDTTALTRIRRFRAAGAAMAL